MARTTLTTRQAARERQAALREQRRRREQAELDAAVAFDHAHRQREQAETAMAAAVTALLHLGNTITTTAQLTGQPEPEIRRLRTLATQLADHDQHPVDAGELRDDEHADDIDHLDVDVEHARDDACDGDARAGESGTGGLWDRRPA